MPNTPVSPDDLGLPIGSFNYDYPSGVYTIAEKWAAAPLSTNSVDKNATSWTPVNLSVTDTAGLVTLKPTTANGAHGVEVVSAPVTVPSGEIFTATLSAKAAGYSRLNFRVARGGVFYANVSFSLLNGTVLLNSQPGNITAKIYAEGGFYNCSIDFVDTASDATLEVQFYIHQDNGTSIFAGDGTSAIQILKDTALQQVKQTATGILTVEQGKYPSNRAYQTFRTEGVTYQRYGSGLPIVWQSWKALGDISFAVWDDSTQRTLKERATTTYCILDAPGGADPSGTHANGDVLREWIGYEGAERFELTPGRFLLDGKEMLIKRPNIQIFGHGTGYNYGNTDAFTKWKSEAGGSAIVCVGTGERYIKTRRKHRLTAADPQDDPLSVGINIVSQGVRLNDLAVLLDCDYTDKSPTNLGANWDVGIMVRRPGTQLTNVASLGYFRRLNFYLDVTGQPGATEFTTPDGVKYPSDPVTHGMDQSSFRKIFGWGGVRGTFGIMGAIPHATSIMYYDQNTGALKEDHRGKFGCSNVQIGDTESWLYGHDHHSEMRRWNPAVLPEVSSLDDYHLGCLFIDGIAGNADKNVDQNGNEVGFGRVQGITVEGVRISTREPIKVRLNRCNRVYIQNAHFDGTVYNGDDTEKKHPLPSYGPIVATNETHALLYQSASGTLKPEYSTDLMNEDEWEILTGDQQRSELFDVRIRKLSTPRGKTLTIANGAIEVMRSFHRVSGVANAQTVLKTIKGGEDGQLLVLSSGASASDILVQDGTGNLRLAGDCLLNSSSDKLTLHYDESVALWFELSRSNNG